MIRTLSSSNVLLASVVRLDIILSTQAVRKTIHSLHLPPVPGDESFIKISAGGGRGRKSTEEHSCIASTRDSQHQTQSVQKTTKKIKRIYEKARNLNVCQDLSMTFFDIYPVLCIIIMYNSQAQREERGCDEMLAVSASST